MIVIRLMGGLGNQLFQYAAGRRLAQVRQVPLKLDLSYYNQSENMGPDSTLRSYSLCHFNIKEQWVSPEELGRFPYVWQRLLPARLFEAIQKRLPAGMRSFYSQAGIGFESEVFDLGDHVYLSGYWQSWRYFCDIQDIIRNEFSLREPLHPESQMLAQEIGAKTSVALHIRRGDYVTNPIIHQVHGICSLDYYRKAINLFIEQVPNPHFYVFSDEPAWAAQNLMIDCPVTYMNRNGIERDYEDLYLMSLCQHFIIANSSFSWWAAWLSSNLNKIVVAPQKWFAERADPVDLLPEKWLRI